MTPTQGNGLASPQSQPINSHPERNALQFIANSTLHASARVRTGIQKNNVAWACEALYSIPADLSRDDWVRVGLGFEATGGDGDTFCAGDLARLGTDGLPVNDSANFENLHQLAGDGPAAVKNCFAGAIDPSRLNRDTNSGDFLIAGAVGQENSIVTALITGTKEPRIDSRLLAQYLYNKHQSLFELIKNYRADFEELGLLRFQTGEVTVGRPEKFAMLNEDQSILALSYCKNTPRVRKLKVILVKAFGEARRAAEMRRTEYLPSYHRLRDAIHTAAAGSQNEKRVHGNVARLLNKTVGIEAGKRSRAAVPQLALMIVAQEMAARDMKTATDHHDGYRRVKQSMLTLSECTQLQVDHG